MKDLDHLRDEYHRALAAFIRGDPEPVLALWSRRDDATLANPFGPPVRGWEAVRRAGTQAAARVADGEGLTVEAVSAFATADLAYEVEIHRFRAKLAGDDRSGPVALRVTTIFRREDVGWRVVHRHADPTTEASTVTSPGRLGR